MSLQDIIVGLRRIPWYVMKALLEHHRINKGRGWDETIPKLEEIHVKNPEKEQELLETLLSIYRDHLIAGEKTVRFFREDKNIEISSIFNEYVISESPFNNNYPFALSEDELKNIATGLHLVEVIRLGEKTLLVFCSKRHISEKIEINPDNFNGLEDYSEVIGIKKYDKQFFDVVVLDFINSVIEIRLDVGNKISSDERKTGFNQIIKAFEELVSKLTSKDYKLSNVINFFPAINTLYCSEEGRVCELAFTTEGGSIKHEKMRRKHDCLRNEAYHQGGSKGSSRFRGVATTCSVRHSQITAYLRHRARCAGITDLSHISH
ncbi:MAG: hypothetical protein RLZ75_1568, partial [Pseudomonadota bacterium]